MTMGWTQGSLAFKSQNKSGETVSGEQGDLTVNPWRGVCDGASQG